MTTDLRNTTDPAPQATRPAPAPSERASTIELLAAVGLAAETVFDGDAESCPHCLLRVLSEAA